MFIQECHKLGFSSGNGKPITHVLMDGGILSVPFSQLDIFYRLCIKHIQNFEKIYVVEQKTEYFNFFVDIDYQSEEALDMREIVAITKIISDKIDTFYTCPCIISVAEPKPKGTKIKTGVHMNWDGLVVDQSNAINLMNHIVSTLNTVYSYLDWATVIDSSVYGSNEKNTRGSGFRMPWSHKKGKHDYCNGKGCVVCGESGKITESEYLPIFTVYDGNVVEFADQTPTVEILNMVTIRSQKTESVINIGSSTPTTRKEEGGFTSIQIRDELVDCEAKVYLEMFVRKYIDGQENAKILSIFKGKNCFFVKTNSKYCENLRKCHNSNHIWFYISKECTIAQKCFCTCLTTKWRYSGIMCKNFEGRKHQLNKKISDILFPNKILTNTKKSSICSYLS